MKKAYGGHVQGSDGLHREGMGAGRSDGKSEESELTDCFAGSFFSLKVSLKDYPL